MSPQIPSDPPPTGSPLGAAGQPRPAAGPARSRRGLLWFVPRPLRRLGRLLLIALIVEYLVVPQIAGTRNALHTLLRVDVAWLALGVALEGASLVAYTQLTRTVLSPESDPGFSRVLRIQLSTLAVAHCVPGGSAAGPALGYRLLSAAGVRRADVGFALATQSLGSAVVLNVIFWLALVVSIPVWGLSAVYLAAAAVGLVLVGAFIGLAVLFSRGERLADGIVGRMTRRLPLVDEGAVHDLFVRLQVRMRTLGRQRPVLARAVLWATANWMLDAASLWVFVGAFGHWANIDGLLVSYGLANVLAAIPITPGGLGVVEATLTSTLVGFGTARAVAILGVVAYRLVNFWLPIPVGGIAYLTLQVDVGRPGGRGPLAWLRRSATGLGTWWLREVRPGPGRDAEPAGSPEDRG